MVKLSERVVNKIAREEGTEPDELQPLYKAVNPDALNQIFKSQHQNGVVVFQYMGYEVAANSDGSVVIE